MAEENDDSQKTEQPTQKRLQDAEDKGDVVQSPDVAAWLVLAAATGRAVFDGGNHNSFGRFAALSQEAGLVPIIEPEVLKDGTHTIERSFEASVATLNAVFRQVIDQRVALEGLLLKASMVLPGGEAKDQSNPQEIARQTVKCFLETVPAAVPGIVFLSGGQSDDAATVNLDAISRHAPEVNAPWQLSFSYGRGLQAAPMKTWGGNPANADAAQRAFLHRAKVTAAAREGTYSPDMEKAVA